MKINVVNFEDTLYTNYTDIDIIHAGYHDELYALTKLIISKLDIKLKNFVIENEASGNSEYLEYLSNIDNYIEADNITLDLIISPNRSVIDQVFETENSYGVFVVSDVTSSQVYNDKFEICIHSDYEDLLSTIVEERLKEIDPRSNRYDYEYLFSHFVTITHEISHLLDYLENVGGNYDFNTVMSSCADSGLENEENLLWYGCFNRSENESAIKRLSDQYNKGEISYTDFLAIASSITMATLENRVEDRGEALLKEIWLDVIKSIEFKSFVSALDEDLNNNLSNRLKF